MKVDDLIAAVGEDKVATQMVDVCCVGMRTAAKGVLRLEIATDGSIDPSGNYPALFGVIVWMDREAAERALDEDEKRKARKPAKIALSPFDQWASRRVAELNSWTQWNGFSSDDGHQKEWGDVPNGLAPNTRITILRRDGREAGDRACRFDWRIGGGDADIIAYREDATQ